MLLEFLLQVQEKNKIQIIGAVGTETVESNIYTSTAVAVNEYQD